MEHIPKSGYYYANKFARIALEAYEEVMGKNGLNAILPTTWNANSILPTSRPSMWRWRKCMGPASDAAWLCGRDGLLSTMS
jgi:hypothetical protein